jgi:redox-sensitive bicupin YhaK (pirin superfamily)
VKREISSDDNRVQTIPAGYNTFIYTLDGTVNVHSGSADKKLVEAHHAVTFGSEGDNITVESGNEKVQFALIAGQPIKVSIY